MLLIGDIGGTKIDLAVVMPGADPREPTAMAEFPSARYPNLEGAVHEYLAGIAMPVERACFAVAGPVIGGQVRTTNLPWVLEEVALARGLGLASVTLCNDLEATARAVPLLRPTDLHTLRAGIPVPGGAIGVIAPGTGLGEAFLTWAGARYLAHASEGGHADFAPTTPEQIGLLRYLQGRFDHVSYELVCSGIGIPHLYDYLKQAGVAPEAPGLARRLAGAADPTRLIVEAALMPTAADPLSVATIELFADILGAEAGNLALKVLATGGVYLAGGLAVRTLPVLESERFARAFRRKGRFAGMLERVPVHVVLARAALIGAAACGLELAAG